MKDSIVLLQKTAAAFKSDRRQIARRGQRVALALFRIALFIGLSYVILYPILYMLSMTFRSDADSLDQSVVWLPKHLVTTNIRQASYRIKPEKAYTLWHRYVPIATERANALP